MSEEFLGEEHWADVGIDIGKRRLAYGWPAWELAGSFDLGKATGRSRDWELRMMQRWLRTAVPDGIQLWLDQSYAGPNIAVAQSLSETIAAVMTAQAWVLPPLLVHSSTWKAAVVGNSQASKVEVMDWLTDHYPLLAVSCHTEDEIDAMVIGLYGQMRSNGDVLPPASKRSRPVRGVHPVRKDSS
jgi:Holliday junction resolvasome RuvABC endonuclease subunit